PPGALPFTPRAKRVLELAVEEASHLGHRELGTEHLLLGLIQEREGIAARVLTNLGLEPGAVRSRVRELRGGAAGGAVRASPAEERGRAPPDRDPFHAFTDRARKVVSLAKDEAKRLDHEYVSTENLLVGLVAEGTGVAANVLRRFGVDLARVRSELEKIVSRSPPVEVRGNLPFTPRAKVALEFAVAEARLLGHPYVGTEHLLLGLIREGEGIAVLVLQRIGVDLAEARTEILEFLGAPEN